MMTRRDRAKLKIEEHYPEASLSLENQLWAVIDGAKEIGPRRATIDDALIAAADLITEPPNTLEYLCGCSYPTTEVSACYSYSCAACHRWMVEEARATRQIHGALAIE
jgi:hypothetical protein